MNAGGVGAHVRRVFDEQIAAARELFTGFTARRVTGRVDFTGKATVVLGMRRSGKTTFLHQLRHGYSRAGIPMSCLPMLSLEDERLTGLTAVQLGSLIDGYTDRLTAVGCEEPVCWFLDEIQTVPDWERLVRRLLDDRRSTRVFVSGSSAALLSREIATALRGRSWQVLIHPFAFDEALNHNGFPAAGSTPGMIASGISGVVSGSTPGMAASGISGVVSGSTPGMAASMDRGERARIEAAFALWLDTGGFPEAQNLDQATRRRLLTDYVDVAVMRDVIDRHRVSNTTGLRWLVRQLLANAAALFSVEKFYKAMRSQGISISRDTVHQHLAHLEDSYLIRTVWMESNSQRQRMVNPRKAYPVDAGLIGVFDRSGRANTGHALETAVLLELERRRSETTYVRTPEGYEVDFLARGEDGRSELIQVCADASDSTTAERELRALAAAGTMHPTATKRLLTQNRRSLPHETSDDVHAQPAYEWMLNLGHSLR